MSSSQGIEYEIERHCSCEKKPGIIQLSSTHILWTPDSAAHGNEVRIPYSNIKNFQVSKEGAAKKAMIRITYADRAQKVTFDFANRFSDRDSIRDVLNSLQSKSTMAAQAQLQQPQQPQKQDDEQKGKQKEKLKPVPKLSNEEKLRRAKIMAHKQVQKLHKQLVGGNVITDEMFWSALKWKYKDNGELRNNNNNNGAMNEDDDDIITVDDYVNEGSMYDNLKLTGNKGVPSSAFESVDEMNNKHSSIKWTSVIPSSSQRHMVFMEKPAISRAYRVKVIEKKQMTEYDFWSLFLTSSISNKYRPRVNTKKLTKSDITKAAQADAIFAPFETAERQLAERELDEHIKAVCYELNLDSADDYRSIHIQDNHRSQGDVPRELVNNKKRKLNSSKDTGGGSEGLRLMKLVNKHGNLILAQSGTENEWKGLGVDKDRPLEDLQEEKQVQTSKLTFKNKHHSFHQLQQQSNKAFLTKLNLDSGNNEQSNREGDGNKFGIEVDDCHQVNDSIMAWHANVDRFLQHVDGNEAKLHNLLQCMRP